MHVIMENVVFLSGSVQDQNRNQRSMYIIKELLLLAVYKLTDILPVLEKENIIMAKTKTSVRGKQDKKILVVKPYTRSDGTRVGGHRRSTPN